MRSEFEFTSFAFLILIGKGHFRVRMTIPFGLVGNEFSFFRCSFILLFCFADFSSVTNVNFAEF